MKGMLSVNHASKNVSVRNGRKPAKLYGRHEWPKANTAFSSMNVADWTEKAGARRAQ
jgi:hypothetical protein